MAHLSESQDRLEVLTGSCCLQKLSTAVVATDVLAAFALRRYAMVLPPDACSGDHNLKKAGVINQKRFCGWPRCGVTDALRSRVAFGLAPPSAMVRGRDSCALECASRRWPRSAPSDVSLTTLSCMAKRLPKRNNSASRLQSIVTWRECVDDCEQKPAGD